MVGDRHYGRLGYACESAAVQGCRRVSLVVVIADETANPAFVAADLLSQAEHGPDSQVVLIAIGLNEEKLKGIEAEVHRQAMALPRVDIVKGAIEHSVTIQVRDVDEAMRISNEYAPEHLILQLKDAEAVVDKVINAGSVFIGKWTPESVGDYSAGVNHSLRKCCSLSFPSSRAHLMHIQQRMGTPSSTRGSTLGRS